MDMIIDNLWVKTGFAGLGYALFVFMLREYIKQTTLMSVQQVKITKVLTLIAERVRVIGVRIDGQDTDFTSD